MPKNEKRKRRVEGFGPFLRQLRASKGLTQTELAQALGVKQATVSYVESGAGVSKKRAMKWLEAMGVSANEAWETIAELEAK